MPSSLNFAADMIWIQDLKRGRLLDVNAATARRLGYSVKELIGKPLHDFYFGAKDREAEKRFFGFVQQRKSGYFTVTLRTRTGLPLEVEKRGTLIDIKGDKAAFVIARDIEGDALERRRALTLYQAFKQSNDVMFYCDRNGVILDVNDAFVQHYGWSREEALGQTPRILRSRHSTDQLYKRMWNSILDPKVGHWRGQMINKTKDGRDIPLILTITAVRDPGGEIVGYVSNAVDVSDQVALQERLAQSETLAEIGEMAAVVAHEIRNPLGSIVMASKQLASKGLSADDRKMVLQVLRGESQRLNETLTNFLSYARPRQIRLSHGTFNELVDDVLHAVRSNPELTGSIRVTAELMPKPKPFPMDRDQIRQVIWNLVLNAIQAMDGKGTLRVETGRRKGLAYLRVRDTGPGIPDSAFANLFKPFHTTKKQGTGLGLAIADRIVKAHGGHIKAGSAPGKGAAFDVFLPAVED